MSVATLNNGIGRTYAALLFLMFGSAAAKAQDAPPPLGKLVDVGGYRVHLYCTGEGSPEVFIVGGFSVDWSLVQPSVAKWARVCTYDVSGTAWSDAGPALTCQDRVSEIHRLVESAAIERPFLFVGFSIGGLVGRAYAAQYPGDVAGMVMVDHAFLPPTQSPPASKQAAAGDAKADSPPVLLYQTPIDFTAEETSQFQNLPKSIQALHRWAAARQPALPTAEIAENCTAQLAGAVQISHPLGNRPLVVISWRNEAHGYAELQSRLLELSLTSKHLMAENSFHSIEIDEPEVVIRGIREAVEAIRGHAPLK